MGEMQVQVPDGIAPGGQMQVMTPQGAMMVQVPPDKKPGDMFTFMVPDVPAAPPMAQGAVVQPAVAQGAVVQPVAAQPATVFVQQQVVQQVVQQPVFYGRRSVTITCPTHGTPSHTNMVAEPGLGTWLLCLGLCCIGCDLGCCFIPFCVDDAKDIKHHCANCGTFVGEKKLIS